MFGCSCPSLLSITSCSGPAHLGKGLTPRMFFFCNTDLAWTMPLQLQKLPSRSIPEFHSCNQDLYQRMIVQVPIKVLLSPGPCPGICSSYSVHWPRKISDGNILAVHTSAFHFPENSRNQLPRPSQESEHHSLNQILLGLTHRKHLRHLSGARQFK